MATTIITQNLSVSREAQTVDMPATDVLESASIKIPNLFNSDIFSGNQALLNRDFNNIAAGLRQRLGNNSDSGFKAPEKNSMGKTTTTKQRNPANNATAPQFAPSAKSGFASLTAPSLREQLENGLGPFGATVPSSSCLGLEFPNHNADFKKGVSLSSSANSMVSSLRRQFNQELSFRGSINQYAYGNSVGYTGSVAENDDSKTSVVNYSSDVNFTGTSTEASLLEGESQVSEGLSVKSTFGKVTVKAGSTNSEDGASVGGVGTLSAAEITVRGEGEIGNTTVILESGFSLGVGFGFELTAKDQDEDGYVEYGFAIAFGPLSLAVGFESGGNSSYTPAGDPCDYGSAGADVSEIANSLPEIQNGLNNAGPLSAAPMCPVDNEDSGLNRIQNRLEHDSKAAMRNRIANQIMTSDDEDSQNAGPTLSNSPNSGSINIINSLTNPGHHENNGLSDVDSPRQKV